MPKEAYWWDGSTYQSASAHWVVTRPYVAVQFTAPTSGSASIELSGSSVITNAHQSYRVAISTGSMPSDAVAKSSTTTGNFPTNKTATINTGSVYDGSTLYVKAVFYAGSGQTGAETIYSSTLTKSGDNTNRNTLIYRPVAELHAWDGGAWRNFYIKEATIEIISAEVFFCDIDNPLAYELVITFSENPLDYSTFNGTLSIVDANNIGLSSTISENYNGNILTITGDLSESVNPTPPFTFTYSATVNNNAIVGSPIVASDGSCP